MDVEEGETTGSDRPLLLFAPCSIAVVVRVGGTTALASAPPARPSCAQRRPVLWTSSTKKIKATVQLLAQGSSKRGQADSAKPKAV